MAHHRATDEEIDQVRDILTNPAFVKENRFEPSKRQCLALEWLNDTIENTHRVMPTDCIEWLATMDREPRQPRPAPNICSSLFFQLENGGRQRKADMFARVRMLLQYLRRHPEKRRVIYMDGHGRYTYALLTLILADPILSNRLTSPDPDLTLCVVDRDRWVHEWHTLFFPTNHVECRFGDIYDLDDGPAEDDFFYFNFCGIGGAEGQRNFADYVLENQRNLPRVLLSLSTRSRAGHGAAANGAYPGYFPTTIVNLLHQHYNLHQGTKGIRFLTLWLVRSDNAVQTPIDGPAEQPGPLPPPLPPPPPPPPRQRQPNVQMTVGELRAFVNSNPALQGQVAVYTGGRNRRTKQDIVQDILALMPDGQE